MPPSRFQLPTILFIFLIAHIAPCLAISCYYGGSVHNIQNMPSDCRHILTHLPFPSTRNPHEPNLTGSDTLDPSSPFFPSATFLHGACSMVFDLRATATTHPVPTSSIRTETAMSAWLQLRTIAERIMVQCTNKHLTGAKRGMMEGESLSYYVGIGPPNFHPWGVGIPLRQQLRAMDSPDYGTQHDLKWTPFYFIP